MLNIYVCIWKGVEESVNKLIFYTLLNAIKIVLCYKVWKLF